MIQLSIVSALRLQKYRAWFTLCLTFLSTLDKAATIAVASDPLSPDDMRITGSIFENSWAEMNIEQTQFKGSFEFNDRTTIDVGPCGMPGKPLFQVVQIVLNGGRGRISGFSSQQYRAGKGGRQSQWMKIKIEPGK